MLHSRSTVRNGGLRELRLGRSAKFAISRAVVPELRSIDRRPSRALDSVASGASEAWTAPLCRGETRGQLQFMPLRGSAPTNACENKTQRRDGKSCLAHVAGAVVRQTSIRADEASVLDDGGEHAIV